MIKERLLAVSQEEVYINSMIVIGVVMLGIAGFGIQSIIAQSQASNGTMQAILGMIWTGILFGCFILFMYYQFITLFQQYHAFKNAKKLMKGGDYVG
jgi:Na+/phosphate symporter